MDGAIVAIALIWLSLILSGVCNELRQIRQILERSKDDES